MSKMTKPFEMVVDEPDFLKGIKTHTPRLDENNLGDVTRYSHVLAIKCAQFFFYIEVEHMLKYVFVFSNTLLWILALHFL